MERRKSVNNPPKKVEGRMNKIIETLNSNTRVTQHRKIREFIPGLSKY